MVGVYLGYKVLFCERGDLIMPIIPADRYVPIIPERIRSLAKAKHITQTYIAKMVLGYEYRHYTRELSKGFIQKEWLEKISTCLDCSTKYLTGESQSPGYRYDDFYLPGEMRKALKQFLKFAQMEHYADLVDSMHGQDIANLEDILVAMLDDPEEFYKAVSMDDIAKIHSRKIFGDE